MQRAAIHYCEVSYKFTEYSWEVEQAVYSSAMFWLSKQSLPSEMEDTNDVTESKPTKIDGASPALSVLPFTALAQLRDWV